MRSGNPPKKMFVEVRNVPRPESNPLGAVKANPHHGGGKSQYFPQIAGVHESKKQPQLHEDLRESGTRSVALMPATSGKRHGRSAGRRLAEPGQQCTQTPLLSLVGEPGYKAARSLKAAPVSGQAMATMQESGALEEQKCFMFPMMPRREPKHAKPGTTLYAHRQLVGGRRAVLHEAESTAVRSSPPRPFQVLKPSQDHVPLARQAVRKPPRQCKRQGSEAGSTPLLSLVGEPDYKAARSLKAAPVSGQAMATMQESGAREEQKCYMFPMLPMREPKHPKPGTTLYAHRQLVPFNRIVPEKVEDKNEDVSSNSRPEAGEVLSQVCHRPLLIRRAVLHEAESRAVRSSPPRPSQVLKLSQDHVPLACQAVWKPPKQLKRQGSEAGSRLPAVPTLSMLNKCEGTSGVKVVNLEVPNTVPFKLKAFKGHRTRFP